MKNKQLMYMLTAVAILGIAAYLAARWYSAKREAEVKGSIFSAVSGLGSSLLGLLGGNKSPTSTGGMFA